MQSPNLYAPFRLDITTIQGEEHKNTRRFWSTLSTLLLTIASTQANTVTAEFDNSANNGGITANGTVNRSAFATNGAEVEFHRRIHGITQVDVIIACCGRLQDVANLVTGAPLNAGCAGSINYAPLGAGQCTVGIEIHSEGCDPSTVKHTIIVATPGDTEFIDGFIFLDAWTVIDFANDNMLIINAATGAAMDHSPNLPAQYSPSGQDNGVFEAYNQYEETHERWNEVQSIFTDNCTFGGCHTGANTARPAADQDLARGNTPPHTIAVGSLEQPNSFRINPGRPVERF